MDGVSQFELMRYARTYLRTYVFSAHAVLKALDLAGRTCNLKYVQVFRSIELEPNNPLQDRRLDSTVLPHKIESE